jgi:hypothetical protein
MENNTLETEVIKYKNSSKLKIKSMIIIYNFLKFANGDIYYFLVSLFFIITPIIIIDFNVINLLFGMLIHYLLFCVLLKDLINGFFKTNDEVKEIDLILNYLKKYLNDKTPK